MSGAQRISLTKRAAAAAVVPALLALTSGAGTARPQPLRLQPCSAMKAARCGTISVPLARDDPSRGRIRIAFALIPRLERSKPSLGTLVYNPGGPGAAVLQSMRPIAQSLAALRARRDLLLVDPRGTGSSGPLRCAALEPERIRPRDLLTHSRVIDLFGRSGAELGARANLYGSAATADDLDDVRAALGIDKLDLIGSSYGTTESSRASASARMPSRSSRSPPSRSRASTPSCPRSLGPPPPATISRFERWRRPF